MRDLARLSARLYNCPLLVKADVAETLAASLGDRLAGLAPLKAWSDYDDGRAAPDDEGDEPDLYTVADGVATLTIRGELVNRGSWLDAQSGLCSYDGIKTALRAIAADPRVTRVVLDMDSPGGEAAGALEAADEIAALGKAKPVTAFVNSLAASAAYWLAAAANEIVCTKMATVGSIGVVWLHLDRSKAIAAQGVKPTLLHAGAYKVDGNPMQALDAGAKARIQGQIDDVYDLFTASVGAFRPKLGQKGAKATEAGLFMGGKAVSAGLADRVAPSPFASSPPARRNGLQASAKGSDMSVSLHKAGEAHASSLIESGQVDRSSAWSFSAADGDKLLGPDGDDWGHFAHFHLGERDGEDDNTKARWAYPYGKGGKVYRSGVIAAKSRAAAEGSRAVGAAAGRLLEKIDGKSAGDDPQTEPNDNQDKEKAAMADQLALAAAKTESATATAARIAAILDCEEAKGREKQARHIAFNTLMNVDDARAILALGAVETPSTGSRMAQTPNPKISADSAQRQLDGQAEIDAMYAGFAKKLNATLPDASPTPGARALNSRAVPSPPSSPSPATRSPFP